MRQGGCSRFQHHPSEVLRQFTSQQFSVALPWRAKTVFLSRSKHCLASRVSVWYSSSTLAMQSVGQRAVVSH